MNHFSLDIQNGCHDETWFYIGPYENLTFSYQFGNNCTDVNLNWQKCKAGGPLPDLWNWCWSKIQHGRYGQLCVLIGWSFKHLFVRNYRVDLIVTLQKWLLDGPVLKLRIICQYEFKFATMTKFSKFQTSCQKLQSGLKFYFVEMFVRWSCTLLNNLLPIRNKIWPP